MVTCCGCEDDEAPQDGSVRNNPARRTRTRVGRHTRAVRTVRGFGGCGFGDDLSV